MQHIFSNGLFDSEIYLIIADFKFGRFFCRSFLHVRLRHINSIFFDTSISFYCRTLYNIIKIHVGGTVMKKVFLAMLMCITLLMPVGVSARESCNHSWGPWETLFEATCGDEGEEYRECSKCYYTEYRDIPATGNHVWGNWLVIQPADCFKSGERVRYCKNCSEEQSESIPAYGHHSWTNWHIDNDANCLNSGKKSRYCTVCYDEQTAIIPKNSSKHEFGSWWATKTPTILKSGTQTRTCFVCGYEQNKTLPKLKARVTLKYKNLSVRKKTTFKIPVKTYSRGDSIKKYSSSKTKVATVTKKGIVRTKKKGTTVITVIMRSGAKATCKVKVK